MFNNVDNISNFVVLKSSKRGEVWYKLKSESIGVHLWLERQILNCKNPEG